LQPWQKNRFRLQSSLTLNLSMTLLARAAWALASSRSLGAVSAAISMRVAAVRTASLLASFFLVLVFTSLPPSCPCVQRINRSRSASAAVLSLVIAEAALELVPEEVSRHPSVRNDARRRELTDPSSILLDRSIHHAAMLRLPEAEKRGRPDLVHLTLLSVTSTPLYQAGGVKVYIHTRDDLVLEFRERTRPPKSYSRFRDLVQQVLRERPGSGLITLREASVRQLLGELRPDLAVGLSVQGKPTALEDLAVRLVGAKDPAAVVGGFPKGHFTPETTGALDALARIHDDPLDAHVVAARLVYEVEKLSRNQR